MKINWAILALLLFLTACSLSAGNSQDTGSVPTVEPPTVTEMPDRAATLIPEPTATLTPTLTSEPAATLIPTPTQVPRTTLLFTGVIAPSRCVQAAIDERGDPYYVYENVRELISEADIAVGTLNASISDISPHTGCVFTYVLVGGSENADALAWAGFDLMSTATNHIKNCAAVGCGDQAFYDTLENLRRVGITPIGAGANHDEAMQPVVVEVNGVRFGFVSLGQIESLSFAGETTPGIAVLTEENIQTAVAEARKISDVVIVMPHWGPEESSYPTYLQQIKAKEIVDAGADLVVGNHTHFFQAMQEIDGVLVFYGLGNFVFDQDLTPRFQQSLILKVTYEGADLVGYEVIPAMGAKDGTVSLPDGSQAAEIMAWFDEINQKSK